MKIVCIFLLLMLPLMAWTQGDPARIELGSQDTSINVVLEQNQSTSQTIRTQIWQSFILNAEGPLKTLSVDFGNINVTDVRLRIFNGVGNSTQPIYNKTYPASSFPANTGLKDFVISPEIYISNGNNYSFELTGVFSEILNSYADNDPYAYGISSECASCDLLFEIEIEQISTYIFSVDANGMEVNADQILLKGSVKDKNGYITPVGSVVSYAGSIVPEGWLACDGSQVSRLVYSDLFAAIGTNWGAGDSLTTFNLPDLRGQFLRGHAGVSDVDPNKNSRTPSPNGGIAGNNVGSYQQDAFQGHFHEVKNDNGFRPKRNTGSGGSGFRTSPTTDPPNVSANIYYAQDIITDAINGDPRTSSETRPSNAYVKFIIKY